MAEEVKRCAQCAFWTYDPYNTCIHPRKRLWKEYVDGDTTACDLFEPEAV